MWVVGGRAVMAASGVVARWSKGITAALLDGELLATGVTGCLDRDRTALGARKFACNATLSLPAGVRVRSSDLRYHRRMPRELIWLALVRLLSGERRRADTGVLVPTYYCMQQVETHLDVSSASRAPARSSNILSRERLE